MKKIQCEACGSTEIKKVGDDLFECQYCGIQYSKDDVKKLLVEITGAVKIDQTDRVKNLYLLARADINKENSGNALKYYESILLEDPTSWEANFYIAFIQAKRGSLKELNKKAGNFPSSLESVMLLIRDTLSGDEQKTALDEIFQRVKQLFTMYDSVAENKYQKAVERKTYSPDYLYTSSLRDSLQFNAHRIINAAADNAATVNAATQELCRDIAAVGDMILNIGNLVSKHFAEQAFAQPYYIEAWKLAVAEYRKLCNLTNDSHITEMLGKRIGEYAAKIKKYEPDYNSSSLSASLTKSQIAEIEDALQNKDSALAIKKYRSYTGKDLATAKSELEQFATENGISINMTPDKVKKAEDWMHMCGIMAFVPYTFLAGIISLFFIEKAKDENGGSLSKRARRGLNCSICGLVLWIFVFTLIFTSI